jgi:hypothetical protein
MTNYDWVKKLQIELKENEDGSANLIFSWDENDPDLAAWTNQTDKEREEFMLNAIYKAIESTPKE